MFDVWLCTTTSPRNYVFKDIVRTQVCRGELREESSIIHPVILIESERIPKDINYLRIQEFGRYYFVEDIVSVRNKLWRIHASVDPLMSFSDELMTCGGVLVKGERNSTVNLMLDDGSFKVFSDPVIVTKQFPAGFPGQSYVLALAGG